MRTKRACERGRETWNPIRTLVRSGSNRQQAASDGLTTKRFHRQWKYIQVLLKSQYESNEIYYIVYCFLPPCQPPTIACKNTKVGFCGFESSALIGIPGGNLIWRKLWWWEAAVAVGTTPEKVSLLLLFRHMSIHFTFRSDFELTIGKEHFLSCLSFRSESVLKKSGRCVRKTMMLQ